MSTGGRKPLLLIAGASVVVLVALAALISLVWTPFPIIQTDTAHPAAGPFTAGHLLGTDRSGRDTLTWLMVGARTTLQVGVLAVAIAAVIGTPLGILAGMAPRRWSEVILRGSDILLAFPALLLAIVFAARFGASVTTATVAVGIATVPQFVRVVRSGTLQVMATDYVLSARISGVSGLRIALVHVLPQVRSLMIVQATVAFSVAILAEAGLSFLGLGAPGSVPSWGRMLNESQSMLSVQPLIAVWPGLAIAGTVLGLTMLGDGLRDRLDPRLAVAR